MASFDHTATRTMSDYLEGLTDEKWSALMVEMNDYADQHGPTFHHEYMSAAHGEALTENALWVLESAEREHYSTMTTLELITLQLASHRAIEYRLIGKVLDSRTDALAVAYVAEVIALHLYWS